MLSLCFSNRFEVLQTLLLANLAAESPGPFDQQQVIVPSAAVRRGLELALAREQGICANVSFRFLAQWLWERIGEVVEVPAESPFTPARLAWRVYALLADEALLAAHPRLAGYLRDADPVARFELAGRIAKLLDHYVSYRPDWLAEWAAGRSVALPGLEADQHADAAWQADLWRRLLADLGLVRRHPFQTFLEAVAQHRAPARPGTTHLFCLPGLPPQHLAMLKELGRYTDIQAYVLNPCAEYWGDIEDARRLARLRLQGQEVSDDGHPLLAAWGKQTRAFVDYLLSEADKLEGSLDLYLRPDPAQLLGRLQQAMLQLAPFPPGSEAELPDEDRSLQVHRCHGLTRELEVLQDQLLMILSAPDAPRPDQVLVVLPDLAAAAPLIDGVFGTAPPARRIPYVITGRPPAQANPVARVLTGLLALLGGRFPASAVFDLLQQAPVAARFGLDAEALASIHGWMQQAGMRWGLDAAQRQRQGLPAETLYTLADGVERLLLGYTLGDVDGSLDGRAACGRLEGSDAQVLGRLWRFLQILQQLDQSCARPQPPASWRALLLDALDALVAEERQWIDERLAVRATLLELCAHMEAGAAGEALPLAVLRAAVEGAFAAAPQGGIPSGAVTFSAMTSLRSLPYEVVCILGLNRGAFPANPRSDEFDLMQAAPRKGDRQRREDDRNLFLDLLLAARRRVYLSYSAFSRRDASLQPPSVLVDELLDHLAPALADDPQDPAALARARQRLCVDHPLQPFSPRLFQTDTPHQQRSHHAEYCAALQQRPSPVAPVASRAPGDEADEDEPRNGEPPGAPLFTAPLPPPDEELRQWDVDGLVRFFRNPCRALLRQRLGLALPDEEPVLADDEPFAADLPARTALAERLLPALLEGVDEAQLQQLARSGAEYPVGLPGERLLRDELASLRPFAATLAPALAEPLRPAATAELCIHQHGETWRLQARLEGLRAAGLHLYRYDALRATDLVNAWPRHLALNALRPAGVAPVTWLHGRDGVHRLAPLPSAEAAVEQLQNLFALLREGLCAPLHFFPKSAWAYVDNDGKLAQAWAKWHNARHPEWGESTNPAYRLALRGLPEPIDDDFERCASAFFGPLRELLSREEQA